MMRYVVIRLGSSRLLNLIAQSDKVCFSFFSNIVITFEELLLLASTSLDIRGLRVCKGLRMIY